MNILVVGLNHKTADVEVREKLAFNGPKLEEGLMKLVDLPEVNEAVVLSTCNRVEMYVNAAKDPTEAVKTFLSEFHGIRRELLDDALYFLREGEAVRHVFRVASSLDSMVVGEPQILGQIKDSFEFSLKKKTTGVILNKLMKKSISVAKRVRTETKIAENAVSISFAAVELAKKIFTDLSDKHVMLLGAGEMAELAAKHLMNSGVRELVVANRTYSTGQELAREMGGRAVQFEEFLAEMVNTDIVICSTGAPTYVVDRPGMHSVMKERKQKPVFIIDISVPRNIDPEINEMANVYLYDVDDLQGVVESNVKERQNEAEHAERIIDEEIETFLQWQSSLDAVPTIIALREQAEAIKKEELVKLINRLPELQEDQRKAVEQMAATIVNKLVHSPTAALKQENEDKDVLIETVKRIFGLDSKDSFAPARQARPAPKEH
jgi:glutamyl-tRNA reductase